MNIQLIKISKSDFKELNLPILFDDNLLDRAFGIVSNGKYKYKIGWQSTDIEPVIILINDILCSIGVDLIFVIFDLYKGQIIMKLFLDYYFYDTKVYNNFLYVITQLEIIKINFIELSVDERYALPDYFESIEFKPGTTTIKCINGEIVSLGNG